MMVNQFNTNNHPPWERTIPQQMPWMNPNENNNQPIHFGQSLPSRTNPGFQTIPTETPPAFTTTQPYPSQTSVSPNISAPITNINNNQPNYVTPSNMFDPVSNPPFNPNPVHLLNQPCLLQEKYTPSDINLPTIPQPVETINMRTEPFNSSNTSVGSLTHIPADQVRTIHLHHQKRGSADMDDDEVLGSDQPPTKQLLSEQKLLKQFGSLQLDKDEEPTCYRVEDPDDSEGSDDEIGVSCNQQSSSEREQFNRYVYLLFKDKKTNSASFGPTDNAIDRLVREEREKHSKAVILWTPPLKDSLNNDDTESDDEEFSYTDHRDFLKSSSHDQEAAFTITEVTDDDIEVEPVIEASTADAQNLEDSMLD